jgi:ligand-binding sensor domain-containing protein
LSPTSDGLARDSVHCVIHDRDGFLWFATGEGISRFDGYSFTNCRGVDGLPDRDVRAMVQTDDGSFLVAPVRSVEAVIERASTVWIGTDAGLYAAGNATPSRVTTVLLNPGGVEPGITAMVRDPAQNLWIGTSTGLFLIDREVHIHSLALAKLEAPSITKPRSARQAVPASRARRRLASGPRQVRNPIASAGRRWCSASLPLALLHSTNATGCPLPRFPR